MPDVRVGGIRPYYEEHGEGAAIACIHGTGSAAVLWEGAFGALARLGRVIALPNARVAIAGGDHMVDPAGDDVLAFLREVL